MTDFSPSSSIDHSESPKGDLLQKTEQSPKESTVPAKKFDKIKQSDYTRSVNWAAAGILGSSLVSTALMAVAPHFHLAVNSQLIAGLMGGLAGCSALLMFSIRKEQSKLSLGRELLENVFEASSTGRAVCDPSGQAIYVNKSFLHYFSPLPSGYTSDKPEELILAFHREQNVSTENFERVQKKVRDGFFGGSELFLKDSSGVRHCYLIEGWPVQGGAGHVSWRVEDITPRVQIREAIQREQARWADFMDHAPVGFFSTDDQGQFLFINATFAKWLGSTPRDMMAGGVRLADVFSDRDEAIAPYDLFQEGGKFQQGEFTLKGPTGRTLQAMIAQTIEIDEKTGLQRTRAVVHDLTPEREWQSALQESQARFRRFFEESPIGVALVAEEGVLAECNPAFLKMIDADASEVLGRSLKNFVDGGTIDVHEQLARAASGEPIPAMMEVKLKSLNPDKDGRDHTAQLFVRRLASNDVTGASLILHFLDSSEQKNLEARFAQSQKMQAIGQLAGGVAHDFNNLLTAMIGFCDLLLLRHKPGDSSFSDIMQIKQNANRAAGLVRQLLAFSRQQTLQPRVLNLTDVLVDLSNLLRRLIGENIELKLIHGRELGLVKADQGQIEQVIINMAVNARDAMVSGGKLMITTSNLSLTVPFQREHDEVPPGDWVAIEIADTGTGIPPEIIDRIFDPFFSTKEVGKGTGLGLSTCYGIVKQTGGHVFVDSEEGRGTRFTIYLPRYVRSAEEVSAESQQDNATKLSPDLTGAGIILLVEDEDAVRMFASRALKNKGYTVLEARSGDHALEVLKEHPGRIDLVVSDVMMPGMDGPTLMREIKKQRPTIHAIFISGYSEERLKESFEAGESIHFLAKPFSLKELAEKVKGVLKL